MLITKQILVSSIVLGAGLSTLSGCGQTGALYLPAKPTPTAAKVLPVPLPATKAE